jgi:hypothetical protein
MSEAIELIVAAYVKLRNRKALEEIKAHRYYWATELKSKNCAFDLSYSIKILDNDIAIIDAGLAKLDAAAAA